MLHIPTGEVNVRFEDFQFFSPVPVLWERIYHSSGPSDGTLLGKTWFTTYDQSVRIDENVGSIFWIRENGSLLELPLIAMGEEGLIRSDRILYRRDQGGVSFRSLKEEYWRHFKALPGQPGVLRLVSISLHRFRLELEYDQRGTLERMTDPSGRVFRIETDSLGRASSVILEPRIGQGFMEETLVEYEYDGAGRLLAVTDALGKVENFEYEGDLLVQRTDRNGHSYFWEYENSGEIRKCTRRWQTGGIENETISYSTGRTKITNALGHSTTYRIQNNQVVEEIDALGHSQTWDFNEHEEVICHTDQLGNKTYYDYDDFGNQVSITEPNGANTSYAFENHHLVMAKNPLGAIWVWTYDDRGFLESRIGPDNDVTRYSYQNDLLAEIIDSNGQKTRLVFNDAFQLEKVLLPNGTEAEWSYDHRGRLTIARNPGDSRQDFQYDPLGRVTAIRSADGNRTYLEYDGEGNITKARDQHHTVYFAYRPSGQLISRKENNASISFSYNRLNQLTAIENEHGSKYLFRYDPLGRMSEEAGFDGLLRRFERDPAGNVRKVLNPDGNEVKYRYDQLGRISGVEYHNGREEVFVYDRAGNLVEATNERGSLKLERDKLGRLVKESFGTFTVESEFDKMGQRIGIRSSLGADIRIGRDKLGWISSVLASNGSATWEAKFERDPVGMELQRLLPGGVHCSWKRDVTGKPLEHRVETNEKVYRHKQYHWQVNDRLKSVTDLLSKGMVRFEHDLFGNLAAANYEDGRWDYKLPDEVGNLFKTPDRSDRKYGPAGALLKDENYTYSYDEMGNLSRKEGKGGRWEYRWHVNGMLREVVKPDGKVVSFTYDALGRRLTKEFDGKVTRWEWDGNLPLHEWVEKASASVDASGVIEASVPENPVTWVFDEGSFSPAAKLVGEHCYSIVSDYLGKPEQMYDGEGKITWDVEYDIYGNIRKLKIGSLNDCPFRFPGQYADGETGLYYNRFRYYDPGVGGYVSQDPIRLVSETLLIYSYVEDSNFWFDPNGLTKFGSGKGEHTAIVNIFDSGGDRIHREVFKSGNMTPEEKALGFPKNSLATHTEARATKELPLSKGQKMQIIGQYPPCNSCKGKMNAKAKASGAEIEYLWKDKKTGKSMKWVACKK